MTLGLKLGRRLVAAVAISGEEFAFQDSRFVPRRAQLTSGFSRYLQQLLQQVNPSIVYFYAPGGDEGLTRELVSVLEAETAAAGVNTKRLTKTDVFGAFGLAPLKTRRELRDLLQNLWPTLSEGKVHRQAALAEAAAVALVGDLQTHWPPV